MYLCSERDGFSYSSVLRILARMFDAEEPSALQKLKARIRKLQSEGLPLGDRPGRGERSFYSLDQVLQMVLFLELAEVGLAPGFVSRLAVDIDFDNSRDKPCSRSQLENVIEKLKDIIKTDSNSRRLEELDLKISPFAMTCSWRDYSGHSCRSQLSGANMEHQVSRDRRQIVLGLNQIGSELRDAIEVERGRLQ